ncbi:hypothetical protein [Chengkuizengella sediminis]|uniref:hypothetical protein n=1 Tax=Chengkuizengella sediminis TaxID=1885917 RepID=UPI00138A3058|nr:hypothetical protein [Chengkuizengella sediminis]NDI33293.1 hypothetical protein [Chengkuizengella sediminis]
MTVPVFFKQEAEPIIIPESGEFVTLLSLPIPACYKHCVIKIDTFFELNFLVQSAETLQQGEPFKLALNYQLLDGFGENCNEITPILAETISGTPAGLVSEEETKQLFQVESNTTPNATVITNPLVNEVVYLVANINETQGGVFVPRAQFRAINASILSSV